MELAFPHRVEYRDGTASIDEIIENLKAQKRLLEEGVRLLEHAIPNMDVDAIQIRVVQVAAGSLITDFLVLVYGAYQKEIEATVIGGIEEMFGTDIPPQYEALVTLATLAVTYFVARYAYDAVRRKKPERPASTHIQGDYNTVINIIADKTNIPASAVEGALHDSIPAARRRSLIKSVTSFLRPREDGRISPVDVKGVGYINPATIAEYPTDGFDYMSKEGLERMERFVGKLNQNYEVVTKVFMSLLWEWADQVGMNEGMDRERVKRTLGELDGIANQVFFAKE